MYTNLYNESMLYAGGFRGHCNKCGIYGHKASDRRAPGSARTPHSSKQLLQIPFQPQRPLFPMPIQPHLLPLLKVHPVSRPMLTTGVNHIAIRVSVNTANVLAIVQPIAMTVNVHPVMRVAFGVGACPAPPSTDAASPSFLLMMVGCDTLSTALVANALVNKYLWIPRYLLQ
jgi:hypothetical protein